MVIWRRLILLTVFGVSLALVHAVSPKMAAAAEAAAPAQSDFWRIEQIPTPPDAVLEVGALEWIPAASGPAGDRLAVALLEGRYLDGDTITVDVADGEFVLR
jgi:hypothetical protein